MPEFPAPFSGRRSLGANLYFPLPYQSRCKVTVGKPGLYYHVGYRTYPQGTQMQPFSMALLPDLKETMDKVGAILAGPAEPFTTEGAERHDSDVVIEPGKTSELRNVTGPSAIVRMELRMGVPPEQLAAALRECVITIIHEGEATPSVWAPLGDFLGSTPSINSHESLPVRMTGEGVCYCNWFIAVPRAATVAILNESAGAVKLKLSCRAKSVAEPELDRHPLLFHAKSRNDWLPQEPQFVDWPMLDATGPGRFVGVMQEIVNTEQGWWGEGDEKVWVDDDTFPSYLGTGSEDYYGYAWCSPALFTHAYHNQSIVTGPGNFGDTAVARYHVIDDIPFQKRIRLDIEKWASAPREYCCTTFWYSAPGATDFLAPVPVDRRRIRPLPEPFHVEGALESEKLTIARRTGGDTQIQSRSRGLFSYAGHLWWRMCLALSAVRWAAAGRQVRRTARRRVAPPPSDGLQPVDSGRHTPLRPRGRSLCRWRTPGSQHQGRPDTGRQTARHTIGRPGRQEPEGDAQGLLRSTRMGAGGGRPRLIAPATSWAKSRPCWWQVTVRLLRISKVRAPSAVRPAEVARPARRAGRSGG